MSNTVLGDRYELHEKLGSGGMSNVYRAKDQILERNVAVKVLAEHLSDDDRFVARFRREALAVAKLIHPNIVQVYDTGVDHGRHFIVMECVEGRSGAQILKSDGVLDPETTVEIGVQACAGLEYAHRHGIIHRDVKPGNLMVLGDDAPGEMTCKLTDFGIARLAEQTRITQVGSVVGTAAYLAPEQVRGEEATPATDVYALGVVLYQFLTGRLPYEGSSLAELAVRQQNEKPLPPITYNSDVPETVSASVMRALEGDKEIRFPTAGAFSDGLERGLRGEDVTVSLDDEKPRTSATFPLAETATRPMERTARTAHRPAPAQPRYTSPAPRPVKKRSFMGRVGRFLIGLIVMIMIAAVVAGAVIAVTDRAASVKVREWAGQSVDDLSDELKQTLRDNTR
ncbi:MAG: serine/threonine protein kinase [Thermoleophilia bacterium]|nr:serine/threonine protein kinase [Thermoleophilia bacterium]